MSVASAAGLGEYVIGRRDAPTRLEINRSALEAFITKSEENDDVIEKDSDKHLSQSEDVTPINIPDEVPSPVPSTPLQRVSSNVPSLHIDIQIHIDSDATPEQIDKIFESMAKHLYNKHGN
jgi:hypothetical protein